MASSLITYACALLLCLSAISITTAQLVDSDGNPLINGGKYYISPQTIGFGGGLTVIQKQGKCPLFITKERDETSPGIPVTLSSRERSRFIPSNALVRIAFIDVPTVCAQPLGWQVIASKTKRYVVTGESNPAYSFTFRKEQKNEFTIIYRPSEEDEAAKGGPLGFHRLTGILGITDAVPMPVIFKKYEKPSLLKMSTSSAV